MGVLGGGSDGGACLFLFVGFLMGFLFVFVLFCFVLFCFLGEC